jgi:RHS repeat-associated protein
MLLKSKASAAHDKLAFEGSEGVLIKEPGYVYIYLSNENETSVEVFFDDFKVEHKKSPVVQMDDYYPFGLCFNSYTRENSVKNKAILFQGQEHIDDLGLGWDSFKWRNHQPDIGRFFNVDPLAEKYLHNSPYAFSENQVVSHRELEGLEKINVVSSEFIAHQEEVPVPNGSGKPVAPQVYNTSFDSAPQGGSDYKQHFAKVESSDGKILSQKTNEQGDSFAEEVFDMMLTGNDENFDYDLAGKDTKNGSILTGSIEGAQYNITIEIKDGTMTFTTTMSGGDENKAYSIQLGNGGSVLTPEVLGTLQQGREAGASTTSAVSVPFTVDENGNAVFDRASNADDEKPTKKP